MSFRSRLRPVKRTLATPVELAWRPVIATICRSMRPRAEAWFSSGKERVLVVAPHPDDEAIGCAGTLLRHIEHGDRVAVAIATDGRRSRAEPDEQQMARVRRAECERAAKLMGVARLEWFGLREGDWQFAELSEPLGKLLAELQPEVIYAPSRVDFHPEHLAVAHALALALERSSVASSTKLRVYQVQVPLTPLLVNLYCDVSAVRQRRAAVLEAYVSQLASRVSAERLYRYGALPHGAPRLVESFWQLSAARYVALHRDAPRLWPDVFRGLRHFPATDPLAWLTGNAERRRLRAAPPPTNYPAAPRQVTS